jgi:hypothetical protein
MALWGNKDSKTATGTVSITTGGAVTGSSTLFTTESKVGNTIKVGTDEYVIVAIASDTACTVTSAVNGGSMTAKTGQSYSLSEKPVFVSKSESAGTGGDIGDGTKVYGVDPTEAAAEAANGTPVTHSGWVRRTVGTGGRAGRTFTEVLVAGGSITGDLEDVVIQDLSIIIGTQPVDRSVTAPAGTTFAVVATTVPVGGTIGYDWEVSTDAGSTWANATGGVYSGADTATLTISDSTGLDGYEYRCNLSGTGATTVTTTAATLTVA